MNASKKNTPYDDRFYAARHQGSLNSAQQILPRVLDAVPATSALDVGCGNGTWLRALKELGVNDYLGVDGDYINRDSLLISPDHFVALNLSTPRNLGRRFDLVMSLEVAEHLPEECADGFIDFLVAHGDVVLFSAAAPLQGGTDHQNEQWPAYWARKFAARGYFAIDGIRSWCFNDSVIDWWYAQNILLYSNAEALNRYPSLGKMPRFSSDDVPAFVHPQLLDKWVKDSVSNVSIFKLLAMMPKALKRAIKRRLFDSVRA